MTEKSLSALALTVVGSLAALLSLVGAFALNAPNAVAQEPEERLDPPRNLTVVRAENGEIELSWDPPAADSGEVDDYLLVMCWDDGGAERCKGAVVEGHSHLFTGLSDGAEYRIKVIARFNGRTRQSPLIKVVPRDTIAPRLQAILVHDSQLVLTYDERLDPDATPSTGAFTVTVNGSIRDVTAVVAGTGGGKRVRLTLTSATISSDAVSVSYALPDDLETARIEDAWENAAASFADWTAIWADLPGPPRNVGATPAYADIVVYWSPPLSDGGSDIEAYQVQWKTGDEDYDESRQALITDGDGAYWIGGLTPGVTYNIRVIAVNAVGSGASSDEVSGTPDDYQPPTLEDLREFIESIVVKYEANHSWLRPTWDYMQEPGFQFSLAPWDSQYSGAVDWSCVPHGDLRKCAAYRMSIGSTSLNERVILHEMGHVYTLTNDLPASPAELGMVQLYFQDLAGRDCVAAELLADMFALSVNSQIGTDYWRDCVHNLRRGEIDPSSRPALEAVESALEGRTPRWFVERYHDSEAEPDLERIWSDLLDAGWGMWRDLIVHNLRDEWGGFCDDRKTREAVYLRRTVITNPWRDGGCVPGAPTELTASATPTDVGLSWNAPTEAGGAPVTGYRIEWKALGEEWDTNRRTAVTDLSDLSQTVTELDRSVEQTFRIAAFNTFGVGPSSEPIVVAAVPSNYPATGAPSIVGTARVGQTLTVDTSPIGDPDGLNNVTYTYQWIRYDGSADHEIDGATQASYTFTSGDVGQAIRVRVSFTDDRGNQETLTSAAVGNLPWSSTLTVGARDGAHGYSFWSQPNVGSLSPHEVEWDGKTYYVRFLFLRDGRLHLGLNNEMFATGFVLKLGDQEFGSAGAEVDRGGASYRFRWADRGLAWSDGDEVSLTLVPSDQNTPALGAPTISGTHQTGQTLTVDTSAIEDADGLINVTYSYQWIASDGSGDREIENATDVEFTLSAAEAGQAIKVRVSFADDRGNRETLTSVSIVPPLTVRPGVDVPSSHDGTSAFTVEIRFSEEVKLSYRTLRDRGIKVFGGKLRNVRRLDKGSNIGWQITVVPYSSGDVTFVLVATSDCKFASAICTRDGRMLSNRLEFTVKGPT